MLKTRSLPPLEKPKVVLLLAWLDKWDESVPGTCAVSRDLPRYSREMRPRSRHARGIPTVNRCGIHLQITPHHITSRHGNTTAGTSPAGCPRSGSRSARCRQPPSSATGTSPPRPRSCSRLGWARRPALEAEDPVSWSPSQRSRGHVSARTRSVLALCSSSALNAPHLQPCSRPGAGDFQRAGGKRTFTHERRSIRPHSSQAPGAPTRPLRKRTALDLVRAMKRYRGSFKTFQYMTSPCVPLASWEKRERGGVCALSLSLPPSPSLSLSPPRACARVEDGGVLVGPAPPHRPSLRRPQ